MLQFCVLGSGSSGNCAWLETESGGVLIDAGFSARQIEQRLGKIGRSLQDIKAIFITHEHGDHVCGLPVLTKRVAAPVYCNQLTAEAVRGDMPDYKGWVMFPSGSTVRLGDLEVTSFSVPHDAYDPVGFILSHALGQIGFLTDLGYATRLVTERVRRTRALILEANHDPRLLQEDKKRPWSVKQRILSRHGHLSNAAAAKVACDVVGDNLEEIYLGHLSSDCNDPARAREAVSAPLREMGHHAVRLHDTSPDIPSTPLVWS